MKIGDIVVILDSPMMDDDCPYPGETGEVTKVYWDNSVRVKHRDRGGYFYNLTTTFLYAPDMVHRVGRNVNT